jgi:4-hydroxy-tetrahydrodipicolinate synthase
MIEKFPFSGVHAAAVTPLKANGAPDLDAWPQLLGFLAERGCHGALLLGTTGEGPSFSFDERVAIWRAAAAARPQGFVLMAGTGTPSLAETVALNQTAFDLGYEAVVVLPPYFFRNASEDGLFNWFLQVIEKSVPQGGWLLGYHIPAVSGVALSVKLLQRLNTVFPSRFGGLKDSSGDLNSAKAFIAGLPGKSVFVGNDKLLADGLFAGAAGSITALANTCSPEARAVYDAFQRGEGTDELQAKLDAARSAMDAMPTAPAYLKTMLQAKHGLPLWPVRAPLQDFSTEQTKNALAASP